MFGKPKRQKRQNGNSENYLRIGSVWENKSGSLTITINHDTLQEFIAMIERAYASEEDLRIYVTPLEKSTNPKVPTARISVKKIKSPLD